MACPSEAVSVYGDLHEKKCITLQNIFCRVVYEMPVCQDTESHVHSTGSVAVMASGTRALGGVQSRHCSMHYWLQYQMPLTVALSGRILQTLVHSVVSLSAETYLPQQK
ncbi:hypothetical protein AVEN_84998-1 [Araneus ventricosus]|uniref:Uncharacterized protein n=1 Tax=Araneus ventricosus TaxID=182803 RepID=A0A4Y2BYS4_ARAVE|nr:hypothetical protein AVEN_84998-1 [Araneus ventricosus]